MNDFNQYADMNVRTVETHLDTNPHNPLIPASASFNSNGTSAKRTRTSLIDGDCQNRDRNSSKTALNRFSAKAAQFLSKNARYK